MFKKLIHGVPQHLRDLWKNRFSSTWNRMSRGAAEVARMRTTAHGENWRRTDKYQKNHDAHPHKFHKNK